MIDLNVLLDVVQKREPHFRASAGVLAAAARKEFEALIPSHCLTTLHYIIARHADLTAANQAVDWVLARLHVQPAKHGDFVRARVLGMADFEDAVVAAVADSSGCAHIITRNVADFADSPVRAATPEEFLAVIGTAP